MGLTYADDTNVTIKRDYQRLAEIDASISSAYAAMDVISAEGIQEYTIVGSRTIRRATLADLSSLIVELEKQRNKYEKRVYMAKGFTGRNHADMGGGAGKSESEVD
jgi:hypothetical protein